MPIFMQPRFYMLIFLSLSATGSVEVVSGSNAIRGHFWLGHHHKESLEYEKFLSPHFWSKYGPTPTDAASLQLLAEKKVSLSYEFTIWLWVSGSLMATERSPGSLVSEDPFSEMWQWNKQLSYKCQIPISLLIPHQHVFQNSDVFTLTLKMGERVGSPEYRSNLLCNTNYFWKGLKNLYRAS